MHKLTLLFPIVFALIQPIYAKATATSPAAQIDTAPSETKQKLISRYMKTSGLQRRIDNGSFLGKYAVMQGIDWESGQSDTPEGINVLEAITKRIEVLKSVYDKYRSEYQKEYEDHLNWEFTEKELRKIVSFLESPVGQHYLEGTWRMDAYTGTSLEEIEAELVKEALSNYRSR